MAHEEVQSRGLFAIIPDFIMSNPGLEQGAKLLYGTISGLSHGDLGYCHASNRYLANYHGVCEKTIQRWLHSLCACGCLDIDTVKNGMKWERKIWIILNFKDIYAKGHFCPDRRDISAAIEGTKMSTYNNSSYKNKNSSSLSPLQKEEEKEIPLLESPLNAKITFDPQTGSFVGLNAVRAKKWKEQYPKVHFEKVIVDAETWAKENPRDDYAPSICSFLKKRNDYVPPPPPTSEAIVDKEVVFEDVEANRNLSNSWEEEYKKTGILHYGIEAGSISVRFIFPNRPGFEVKYILPKKDFVMECEKGLKAIHHPCLGIRNL